MQVFTALSTRSSFKMFTQTHFLAARGRLFTNRFVAAAPILNHQTFDQLDASSTL